MNLFAPFRRQYKFINRDGLLFFKSIEGNEFTIKHKLTGFDINVFIKDEEQNYNLKTVDNLKMLKSELLSIFNDKIATERITRFFRMV